MSYVDAFYNRDKDIVQVVERVNGKRVYNDFPAWRTFYVKDPRGDHVSIHGDKVRQIKCKRLKDLPSLMVEGINNICLADHWSSFLTNLPLCSSNFKI